MNPEQVRAYLDANPAIRDSTAQWLQSQGERRDVYQWVADDINQNPSSVHRQQYEEWQRGATPASAPGGVQATPDLPPQQLETLIARADAGDQAAIAELTAAGYENVADTENLPIEQGVLQTALPGILGDIEGDVGRRTLVDTLTGQATQDYDAARAALSPEESARRLAEELAQADAASGAISASAAQAAQEQLAALQASIAAMQQNLTGDLAARAAALQQQIASFSHNIDAFDATQKAALAEQIAATQQNLEQSINAQRQALTNEVAALRGAADANSLARKAALQAELDGLTAAQAPMAKARLDSANALTTAVNLGLQSTQDRLTAERARQGYIGSSSFSDAAQARAAIAARQQAAQAMGGAREANAADIRAIQTRGATEGRTLADQYASDLLALSGREATGTRSLADILATGTQSIGDAGAAGRASINVGTGATRKAADDLYANQQYQDQTMGSTQLRSLLDALAQGQGSIAGTRATQQQAARDAGTAAKQGYFDNEYTRRLGGTLARPGLSTGLASTLTALGDYGSSGLRRGLGSLEWWATNPSTPPTPGVNAAPVDTSGNAISGLGASLVGSAMNVGAANDWWRQPKTTPATGTNYGTWANAPATDYYSSLFP